MALSRGTSVAGKIEYEVHDLIYAALPNGERTSDHEPVCVEVTIND